MQVHRALVLLGLAAILAWGTAASDDGPIKIGVVDIDRAIGSTTEGQAAREKLERRQREAEAQVQPMVERYRKLEEELETKKFALSDEALFQKQLDLAELRNQIENKMKELEGQLKLDQRRIEEPLTKKLVEIIRETGEANGFTVILRRGGPSLLYTKDAVDITDLVIEKYNEKD